MQGLVGAPVRAARWCRDTLRCSSCRTVCQDGILASRADFVENGTLSRLPIMGLRSAESLSRLWVHAGGQRRVDVGALEPLLWRDGQYRIADLVAALRACGVEVRLTTNGSLLVRHAESLARAGLNRLRVSWHTLRNDRFQALAGGYGNYRVFQSGIELAAKCGITLSFNRLLLRGTLDDLAEQIAQVRRLGATLKLYDLLWTPGFAEEYNRHFVSAVEVARRHLVPVLGEPTNRLAPGAVRDRWVWALAGGGEVSLKASSEVRRDAEPCAGCDHKAECLEAFGEYVRVGPALRLYLCYLRRDIGFDLQPWLSAAVPDVSAFVRRLASTIGPGHDAGALLRSVGLRLTVIDACNFHCTVPGSGRSWCLEETPGARMPPIKLARTGDERVR